MHAVIAQFRMDPARLAPDTAEMRERIIPFVKHQPGFVSGHWTYDRARTRYVSFIAFDTEEQARGLLDFVAAQAPGRSGVAFESGEIVEVMGHSRAQ